MLGLWWFAVWAGLFYGSCIYPPLDVRYIEEHEEWRAAVRLDNRVVTKYRDTRQGAIDALLSLVC